MDLTTLSAIGGLVTGTAALIAAFATYRKNKADLILAATNAAETALKMKEKQVDDLKAEVAIQVGRVHVLERRVKAMARFIDSLLETIGELIIKLESHGIEHDVKIPEPFDCKGEKYYE